MFLTSVPLTPFTKMSYKTPKSASQMEFWWDSRPFTNSNWSIAWAADKYTQPITALQPHYSQINKPK